MLRPVPEASTRGGPGARLTPPPQPMPLSPLRLAVTICKRLQAELGRHYLHLKDRRKNNGPNVPWGEGDTPIREVLQLMKREKYDFMATIELEYPIPQGSDTMTELAKCVRFVEEALATT